MNESQKTGLRCHCGLVVPRDQLVDFLCPECRLVRILTEYDRPAPGQVSIELPGGDPGLFATR